MLEHKYRNTTYLNALLDDLRPNTEYEFSVKVLKGGRESPWSQAAWNQTQEAAPTSPPRDLEAKGNVGDYSTITLTWLHPITPNGRINGYVIFYTDDQRRNNTEWIIKEV